MALVVRAPWLGLFDLRSIGCTILLGIVAICGACVNFEQQGTVPGDFATAVAVPETSSLRLLPHELPANRELVFGVNTSAAGRREDAYGPLSVYLEEVLGVPVKVISYGLYEELIEEVVADRVDMSLLPPLSYVVARKREPNLQLIAQQMSFGARTYSSYIVVSADDTAQSLSDLRGKRVTFVSELSTSGFLFPYAAFLETGIDPEHDFSQVSLAGGHINALEELQAGLTDGVATASGMITNAATMARERGQPEPNLRILAKVGRIPYDAMCASPRLLPGAIVKIRGALVSLNSRDLRGRSILAPTLGITGWLPAEDQLYDGIRSVQELVLAHQGKSTAKVVLP